MKSEIKYTFLFCLFFLPLLSLAQEIKYIIEHDRGNQSILGSYTIHDERTEQLYLFLYDKSNTFLYVLDNQGEVVNKQQLSDKNLINNDFKSYAIEDSNLLVITSSRKAEYFTQINVNSGVCTTTMRTNKNSEIEHLCWNQYQGKSIGIGAYKDRNAFLIYTIDALGNRTEKLLNLEDQYFFSQEDLKQLGSINRSVIVDGVPTNLLVNSSPIKMYKKDHKLILTYDLSSETRILNINLNSLEYEYHTSVNDWEIKDTESKILGNSYILEDYLMQIKLNEQYLLIKIKDLQTDTLLKDFTMNYDEYSILYKSKIHQFGGENIAYNKMLEYSKNPNILNNIVYGDLSIAAQRTEYGIQIQYGRATDKRIIQSKKNRFGDVPMNLDNIIHSLQLYTLFYLQADYSITKIVQISSTLDDNFGVRSFRMINSAFDTITIADRENKRKSASSITIRDKDILYGYYLRHASEYIFKSYSKTIK